MSIDEKIDVMKAYEAGKTIEWRLVGHNAEIEWDETKNPCWDFSNYDYRVKPEPKCVPYDTVQEVEKDKWVVGKTNNWVYRINAICYGDNTVKVNETWCTLRNLMENYTYEDGSPCGKLVEE